MNWIPYFRLTEIEKEEIEKLFDGYEKKYKESLIFRRVKGWQARDVELNAIINMVWSTSDLTYKERP